MDLKQALDDAINPVMTAYEEFKAINAEREDEIAKFGTATTETEAKLEKINEELGKYEDLNAKLTAAEAAIKAAKEREDEAEKTSTDLKEQLEQIELRLNRPLVGGGADEERKEEYRKYVNNWARGVVGAYGTGVPNLPEAQANAIEQARAEYKVLTIADDTTGGYLAPSEFVNEIIKGVTELSPARQVARVRQTSNKSIMVPRRSGQFAAVRTTEAGTRSETTGLTYGMEEIFAPEMYALIDVSEQNLEDSAFDLEAEIRMESEEQFAKLEGTEFVSGDGVKAMEGILAASANVGTTNSGNATLVTADGLIDTKHAIKTAYTRNANWLLNRTTLGSVRKLKDGNGQYLWMPGIAAGKPNTIDGDPYVEFPDMPNEGAGLNPVAYGDFNRAYQMVDRVGMAMLRDPYTQATSGNIRFLFRRRTGGGVVLAEAIRLNTCSA